MTEQTVTPIQMRMTLPRLSPIELGSLIHHAEKKLDSGNEHSDAFCNWLIDVCETELVRRDTPGAEPSMLQIPPTLRPFELSSFAQGALVLSRSVLTPAQGNFVDELELHVICCVSSYLQQLDAFWEQAQ